MDVLLCKQKTLRALLGIFCVCFVCSWTWQSYLLQCFGSALPDSRSLSVSVDEYLLGPRGFVDKFDRLLAEEIRQKYLYPPSNTRQAFQSTRLRQTLQGEFKQSLWLDALFKHKLRNGFFIESGADDGQATTNTAFFELKRNWTGLLVEPNPERFRLLLTRKRKAYAINSCLSVHPYPEKVDFIMADFVGGIKKLEESNKLRSMRASQRAPEGVVQCLPFFSVLLAVGNPRVDMLSLDVEGAELGILSSLPWEKVDIGVILVEVEHSDSAKIEALLRSKNYSVVDTDIPVDKLFVQNKMIADGTVNSKLTIKDALQSLSAP